MHNRLDPVDRALESLRSQRWTGDPNKTELEERLMGAFNTPQPSRFNKYRALLIALAVVLVGGAGFAATGGAAALKRILVSISVGGEVNQFEMDADGEGTFTFEAEDGSQATVHVQSQTDVEPELGGEGTMLMSTIDVHMQGSAAEGETEIAIDIAGAPDDGLLMIKSCDDVELPDCALGDDAALTQAIAESLGEGVDLENLHILRRSGEGVDPETGEPMQQVAVIAGCGAADGAELDDVNVEIDEETGIATIRIVDQDGNERILKMNVPAEGQECCAPGLDVQVAIEDDEEE